MRGPRPETRRVDGGAFAFTVIAGVAILTLVLSAALDRPGVSTRGAVQGAEATPAVTVKPARSPDAVAPLSASDVSGEFVRGNAAPVIFSGQVAKIVLVFRNTGSVPWIRGTEAEARLGIFGDDRRLHDLGMSVDWPDAVRPAVQDERIVLPQGTAQFSFRVRGTVPGRYTVQIGPVVDGVAWAGGSTLLDVTVR